MSGSGASVFCFLPKDITSVLKSEPASEPVATRIACTLGPRTQDVATLEKLLLAGMRVARFDFTNGDLDFHQTSFTNLRRAMVNVSRLCAVMVQPHGPEIRVINRPPGPIHLTLGQTIKLSNNPALQASAQLLPVTWRTSFVGNGLQPGSSIFVGQYLFSGAETTSAYLTVTQVEDSSVTCSVNNTCSLEGDTLVVKLAAGARNPSPCMTETDVQQLAQWVERNPNGAADFLALPRTRSAADVEHCRAILDRLGLGKCKVVAKLEDIEGLVNHEEILARCEAVVFSRGALGTCMEVEKVFLAQKMLLRSANSVGKPCFVTRVMDSITDAPRPTRAEATDMANLVLDGADGVLLGSETFRGKYPVEAVLTVAAICRSAEVVFDNQAFYRSLMDTQGYFTLAPEMDRMEALASAAVRAANKVNAKLIVAFTVTGRTARLLAKYKPVQPILTAVCRDPKSALYTNRPRTSMDRKASTKNVAAMAKINLLDEGHMNGGPQSCLLFRGSIPVLVDAPSGSIGGDVLDAVLDYAKAKGLVKKGDRVVVSQCPRDIGSEVMSEAGVVQLVTVDEDWDTVESNERMVARKSSLFA